MRKITNSKIINNKFDDLNYEIISSLIIHVNYKDFCVHQVKQLISKLNQYFPDYEFITSEHFMFSPLDYLIFDSNYPEKHDHYWSKLYDTDSYPIYHNIIDVIPKNTNLNNDLQIKLSSNYLTHFEISCFQSHQLKVYANQLNRIFSNVLNPIVNLYSNAQMAFDFKTSQKKRLALIELNQIVENAIKQFDSKSLIYLYPKCNELMNHLISKEKVINLIKTIIFHKK